LATGLSGDDLSGDRITRDTAMIIAFPVSTDAPVYHFPFATIGLIAVNTLVFAATATMDFELVRPWALSYGAGLHPVQWLTCVFLHAGIAHLLANMVFLWTFGLVTEGKIGWWRFLAIYLAIGIGASGIKQVMFLGLEEPRVGLGASGAIFGLMAMSLVWAPVNEVHLVGAWLFFVVRIINFEVTILSCAGGYIALNLLLLAHKNFSVSGELSHLLGALLGAIVAVVWLKLDWVDCEHWDMFAVWEGRKGKSKTEAAATPRRVQVEYQPPSDLPGSTAPLADLAGGAGGGSSTSKLKVKLSNLIDEEKADAALAAHDRLLMLLPDFVLPEPQLLKLIELLRTERRWNDSVQFMERYLKQYETKAVPVRLRLAQVLIEHEQRPSHALKILKPLASVELGPKLSGTYSKLVELATQKVEEGLIELDGQGW
jgi:membrane associated rhomboid family serine protease